MNIIQVIAADIVARPARATVIGCVLGLMATVAILSVAQLLDVIRDIERSTTSAPTSIPFAPPGWKGGTR